MLRKIIVQQLTNWEFPVEQKLETSVLRIISQQWPNEIIFGLLNIVPKLSHFIFWHTNLQFPRSLNKWTTLVYNIKKSVY